jgi:MarR family 2-MHQ and catechol resistance regulon transcriptional repressor
MATKRRLIHTPARGAAAPASSAREQLPAPAIPIADPATATALKLWLTLAKAFQAVAEVSRIDIGRHNLSPAEFATLEALYHKGPLLLGDLQRKVLVSSGGTTFLVDRLAKRGLVERQSCASDRRARYAALTREGVALMRRVFPLHAEAMREALQSLSSSEQKLATTLLKRLGLAAAAQAAAEPGCREGIGGV